MQGPELYYVMAPDKPPLLVAYKPDMIADIEIQGYGDFSQKCLKVSADITFPRIKQQMQQMLGLGNVVVESASDDRLCAIQYNF
jgi:hypothetical protein